MASARLPEPLTPSLIRIAVAVALLYGIATAFLFRTQPDAWDGDPNPKVDAAAFFAAGALWREGSPSDAYAHRSEVIRIEVEQAAGVPQWAPSDLTLVRVLPGEALGRAATQAGYADATPPVFVYLPGYLPVAGMWSLPQWRTATWLLDAVSMTLLALVIGWTIALATLHWQAPWHRWALWGGLLVVLPFWHPVRFGLFTGQVSILAMLAVLLTAVPRTRNKVIELLLGAAVVLLGALKLFPLLAMGLFSLRREHLRHLGALGAIVLLVLVGLWAGGPLAHEGFREVLAEMGRGARPWTHNQSTEAFLHRFLYPVAFTGDWIAIEPTPFRPVAVIWALGLLGGLTVLFWRRRANSSEDRLRDAALLLAVLLLIPPVSWTHYYVFLLPGALWLLLAPGSGRASWCRRIIAAIALIVCAWSPDAPSRWFEPMASMIGEGPASALFRLAVALPWMGAIAVAAGLALNRVLEPPIEIAKSS